MDPNSIQAVPTGMTATLLILIQVGIIVWIFAAPVLILRKLSEIADILRSKKEKQA